MAASTVQVNIIGAGLAGLGAALALHSHNISCAIYEQSSVAGRFAGAINLSPNSLGILDKWGVYKRIVDQGHSFEYIDWQDENGGSVDHQWLGSEELFGYKSLRIYRNVILAEMQTMVKERGVQIHYDKKLTRIVSEREDSVTIEFEDGEQVTSALLIAADGIHSKIRNTMFPDIQPIYTGMLAVAGSVKRTDLALPSSETLATPITQASKAGAVVLATQKPDGSELLVGTTRRYPEQDRAGWSRIANDFKFQQGFLEEGLDVRSELIRSALTHIADDTRYTWPQRYLPPLPQWTSTTGRVVIIGDAAHAIPPVTAQGASQAFEDAYTLARVLHTEHIGSPPEKSHETSSLASALRRWQTIRQDRIAQLRHLTQMVSNMWLTPEQKKQLKKEEIWQSGGSAESLRWLYAPDLDFDL